MARKKKDGGDGGTDVLTTPFTRFQVSMIRTKPLYFNALLSCSLVKYEYV